MSSGIKRYMKTRKLGEGRFLGSLNGYVKIKNLKVKVQAIPVGPIPFLTHRVPEYSLTKDTSHSPHYLRPQRLEKDFYLSTTSPIPFNPYYNSKN